MAYAAVVVGCGGEGGQSLASQHDVVYIAVWSTAEDPEGLL